MPTDLSDLSMSTSATWEIDKRLAFHVASGEMLQGLNYDVEGKQGVEGKDGFPLIQPAGVSFNELLFAGANDGKLKNPVSEELTLHYRIGCLRKDKFVRRNLDANEKKGLLDWLGLIRDAIETETSGDPDPTLSGTVIRPIDFSISENETTQLAFYCILELKLYTRPYYRSERHKLYCV